MSLYQIRARQGPHIKTYLISWQLFAPKISLEIHCWPILAKIYLEPKWKAISKSGLPLTHLKSCCTWVFCHLCKKRARTEKETERSAHHRHRGPEGAPVDLAEEGESEDETDLTDLVARKHPGSLLKQNIICSSKFCIFPKPLTEFQTASRRLIGRRRGRRSLFLEQSQARSRWRCTPEGWIHAFELLFFIFCRL